MSATMRFRAFGLAGAFVFSSGLAAIPAQADVVISSTATKDMSCSAGVCAPTAASAVLNAGDLESMLASGNVEVTTTGSGVEADNIEVKAPFSWSASNALALEAYDSIAVAKQIAVAGTGGLTLVTNNGGSDGTFSTGPKGRVSFANLSSMLKINGASYTLIGSVKSLASAIANNASGDYALADDYNASQDGTYSNTPVTTYLTGFVEGLGNTISNIHVDIAKGEQFNVGGLFLLVESGAKVENLGLVRLDLKMEPYRAGISQNAGGLTDTNEGTLFNDHVNGKIEVDATGSGGDSLVGGFVGENAGGTIGNSSSTARVNVEEGNPGGLVGDNLLGKILGSYSTGTVTADAGGGTLGGLTSDNDEGEISNSYATGAVEGKDQGLPVGGFIGANETNNSVSASYSYSAGTITTTGDKVGGFIGDDYGGTFEDCYWDTTTSLTGDGTSEGNVAGITGLTTKQLTKKLPAGFDPTIWARDKKINNGFPYLIANPPVKK